MRSGAADRGEVIPAISVIVLNWNGAHLLPACLDSLRAQTVPLLELIVPDNGSTDGSRELLATQYPEAQVIPLGSNLGFSRAVNAGIKASRGDAILLLNNDTELAPCCLAELLSAMQTDETVGMCAPKMVYADDPTLINSAGHACGPDGVVVDIGRGWPDGPWFEQPREVLGACAGAALYRRAMLEEIGLFDESFFISFEDADLNWRAQLAGWRCRYVPTAVVKHREGVSRGIRSPRAVFLGLRNSLHVWAKDWPLTSLARHAPVLWRGLVRALFSLMCQGRTYPALSAVAAATARLPLMLGRRSRIIARRAVPVTRFEELLILGHRHTRRPPEA